LSARKGTINRYEIGWRDGEAVREYAAHLGERRLTQTLDEHFLRHPLDE
jgi:hypothetical protein